MKKNSKVFIIAEAGVNHNGNISLAYELIDKACEAGANAVKFQTFKAEDVVTPSGNMANYQKHNLGLEESQFNMLKKLELKNMDFIALKKYSETKGIMFLSTPHGSFKDIDFLDSIGMKIFKFGSGDLTNTPALRHAAKKRKPMIIGTGMSFLDEIEFAIKSIKEEKGDNQITMLHCTTNYPCPLDEVNMGAMQTMMNKLDVNIGYSDHTLGYKVSLLAVCMGAKIIEKHFTLDKNMKGPDHTASASPQELKSLILKIRQYENGILSKQEILEDIGDDLAKIMGSEEKKPNKSELKIMKEIKKSIVLSRNLKAGDHIQAKDLSLKRPMGGLAPKHYYDLIGKKINKHLLKNQQITFSDID